MEEVLAYRELLSKTMPEDATNLVVKGIRDIIIGYVRKEKANISAKIVKAVSEYYGLLKSIQTIKLLPSSIDYYKEDIIRNIKIIGSRYIDDNNNFIIILDLPRNIETEIYDINKLYRADYWDEKLDLNDFVTSKNINIFGKGVKVKILRKNNVDYGEYLGSYCCLEIRLSDLLIYKYEDEEEDDEEDDDEEDDEEADEKDDEEDDEADDDEEDDEDDEDDADEQHNLNDSDDLEKQLITMKRKFIDDFNLDNNKNQSGAENMVERPESNKSNESNDLYDSKYELLRKVTDSNTDNLEAHLLNYFVIYKAKLYEHCRKFIKYNWLQPGDFKYILINIERINDDDKVMKVCNSSEFRVKLNKVFGTNNFDYSFKFVSESEGSIIDLRDYYHYTYEISNFDMAGHYLCIEPRF